MSSTIESIVDAVETIYHYRTQRTLYECDCAIREKLIELRSADYFSKAGTQRSFTIELQRCKRKVANLKQQIADTDLRYRDIWLPVINELEIRISDIRSRRKTK